MNTASVANRLVELCREGKFEQAYDELFAKNAENIEMPSMSEGPLGNAKGLDAIRAKGKAWGDSCISRDRQCTRGGGCACDG